MTLFSIPILVTARLRLAGVSWVISTPMRRYNAARIDAPSADRPL
jgi:hypothetical protein